MSAWDELVSGALLGTERRPLPPEPPSALAALFAGDGRAPETSLLLRAGALATYRAAGVRAWQARTDLPPGAEHDGRPAVDVRAADRLAAILSGTHPDVLQEWLALAAAVDRRVPDEHVPALLARAAEARVLRPAVAAMTGPLGRWLGALNEDWAWAAGTGDDPAALERTWATGTPGARLAALTSLRRLDAARARALVERSFGQESPDDRAAFVAVLREGLGDADEPFLEATLDDRRQVVRRTAAELLARLPASRLCGRVWERVAPLLTVEGSPPRLVLALPETCDAAMVRDGVAARPPAAVGERSWWLTQLLEATPLHRLEQGLARPPDAVVALPVDGDRAVAVHAALAVAAGRQGDVRWARALAPVVARPAVLVPSLPRAEAERLARERLLSLGTTPEVQLLLAALPAPWGAELSRAAIDALVAQAARDPLPNASLVRLVARTADPALHRQAAHRLSSPIEAGGAWGRALGMLVELLRFRHDLAEELT